MRLVFKAAGTGQLHKSNEVGQESSEAGQVDLWPKAKSLQNKSQSNKLATDFGKKQKI